MDALASAWARLFSEERDAYLLGLLRLAIATLLLLHCGRLGTELYHNGYFADYFHVPIVPESWLPNGTSYALLLAVQALAALLALIGWAPRAGLLAAASIGLYVLCCDRLQYHNNRYALLLLGLLLAFTPCDRSFLLARGARCHLPHEQRCAPTFARRLFQIQVSLVYLGSALGKLLDADWRGGQVLLLRFATTGDYAAQHGVILPNWVSLVLASAVFASVAAKAAIATELSIALGAWFARTRRLALWLGVWFHIGIELSARVELFSWLMLCSYLAFVTPELRERRFEFDPAARLGRWLAHAVRALDWCARFEIAVRPASEMSGAPFRVSDRSRHQASGRAGIALLAAAIPLLFPLWLPLALIAGPRRTRPLAS